MKRLQLRDGRQLWALLPVGMLLTNDTLSRVRPASDRVGRDGAKLMALLMDKACDITPFADVESTRYALGAIFYDHARGAFVATDSRVLAIVEPPVRQDVEGLPDGPVRDVLLPIRAVKSSLQELRKSKKTKPLSKKDARCEVAAITANGAAGANIETAGDSGETRRSVTEVQGRFPRWPDVLRSRSSMPHAFTMDPKYLLKIAQFFVAHGCDGGTDRGVVVRFSDSNSSVEFSGLVNGRRAYVVAMPMFPDDAPAVHNEPTASEKWPMTTAKKSKKK